MAHASNRGHIFAMYSGGCTVIKQNKQLRVVLMGMMGSTPFAGVAWQVIHYIEGFRRLGCDVYYVEDTGTWPYDPEANTITDDCGYTVDYLARLMNWCGMGDRWVYRAASQGYRVFGLSQIELSQVIARADVLVNLTGSTLLRDEHLRVPIRIYLETDPVLPQIEIAKGHKSTIDLLSAHTHHFSYGENFGAPDCGVPIERFHYQPTRQPIVLEWWPDSQTSRGAAASTTFTTIANWEQSGKEIEWDGESYTWSKHIEFLKFIDLPRRTPQLFELALAIGDTAAVALLESSGWRITDALLLSRDFLRYRDYILSSRGEFTVAKDQNIRLRSGWFSDRSACYLAAGRPVITQDTGFGNIIPTGRGLFAFKTMGDILAALDAIMTDYEGHARAAREIAAEYFAAERVVASLLGRVGVS